MAPNNTAGKSTDVAVHAPQDTVDLLGRLGQIEDSWSDLDDLDLAPEETQIPVIKISRKADGSGGIKLSGDDDETDTVEFVWAARGVSRIKFAKAYEAGADIEIDCRSTDGKAPVPHQPLWANARTGDGKADPTKGYTQPATCSVCPHSFENGATGPTACKKSLEALVYLQRPETTEAIDVARFRFGGLAYKQARLYWESFQYRIPKRRPIGAITRMTLQREKTPNGVFFVPHFDVVQELTRAQADVFITDAKSRLGAWQQHIADDLGPVGDVAADAGDPFADQPVNTVGASGATYDGEGNEIIELEADDAIEVDIDDTAGRYADSLPRAF